YMPLFALAIAFLGKVLHTDYFTVARALQPILTFSVVLSVSYVAKKFYGDVAGISAGFLIMSSYLFSRLVSPLPETMALIFIPLALYFYYKSVEDKKYLYALLSGFMFLIVLATHQAATMILFLIITAVAVLMTLSRRKFKFFVNYLVFLAVPVGFGVLAAVAVLLMAPGFLSSLLSNGLTSVTGLMTALPNSDPISNLKYVIYIGILLIFAIIGAGCSLKKRRDQDIIIFTWIIVVFLISKAYWFGVNVYTIRLLVYILLPLSILAGYGLSYLYTDFKKKEFPSIKIRSGFLIATFVVAALFAVVTVEDPNFGLIPKYDTISQHGIKSPQLAPPTESDIELANWFKQNGDKKSVVISNNYYSNQFLLAVTGQPIGS
ncbi:MAG TPA: 6-pyruvoyl tetrahydropterin synthase, partial [Bacteroidales bacterium]|nr:6-pyruvoyl tetrahydropterin synthase [Bacteroidales bacterium]